MQEYTKFEAILTLSFGGVALTSEPGIFVDSKLATHTSMSVAIIIQSLSPRLPFLYVTKDKM